MRAQNLHFFPGPCCLGGRGRWAPPPPLCNPSIPAWGRGGAWCQVRASASYASMRCRRVHRGRCVAASRDAARDALRRCLRVPVASARFPESCWAALWDGKGRFGRPGVLVGRPRCRLNRRCAGPGGPTGRVNPERHRVPVAARSWIKEFARAVLKNPKLFFCEGRPNRTAPKGHQPPIATNRQRVPFQGIGGP